MGFLSSFMLSFSLFNRKWTEGSCENGIHIFLLGMFVKADTTVKMKTIDFAKPQLIHCWRPTTKIVKSRDVAQILRVETF